MGLRQAGLDEFETVFETFFFDFASCLWYYSIRRYG